MYFSMVSIVLSPYAFRQLFAVLLNAVCCADDNRFVAYANPVRSSWKMTRHSVSVLSWKLVGGAAWGRVLHVSFLSWSLMSHLDEPVFIVSV